MIYTDLIQSGPASHTLETGGSALANAPASETHCLQRADHRSMWLRPGDSAGSKLEPAGSALGPGGARRLPLHKKYQDPQRTKQMSTAPRITTNRRTSKLAKVVVSSSSLPRKVPVAFSDSFWPTIKVSFIRDSFSSIRDSFSLPATGVPASVEDVVVTVVATPATDVNVVDESVVKDELKVDVVTDDEIDVVVTDDEIDVVVLDVDRLEVRVVEDTDDDEVPEVDDVDEMVVLAHFCTITRLFPATT